MFCGPPSAGLRQILGVDHINEVAVWFDHPQVYYVHKARTAINKACRLLHLEEGTEILAPAYNCGMEIDALRHSGASVVLYQIDKEMRIDFIDIRSRVSHKTKAIYVTHFFGFPQRLTEIKDFCNQNNIYLIEDCALSLFSSNGATTIGSMADISIFSFPKTLPVPDGGMMVINNPDLAMNCWSLQAPKLTVIIRQLLPLLKSQVLRALADKGILYSLSWNISKGMRIFYPRYRHTEMVSQWPDLPISYYYDVQLSDKSMSKVSLRMLATFNVEEVISRRNEIYVQYLKLLSDVAGVKLLFRHLPQGVCPLKFPIIVRNRKRLCEKLNELSIDAITWWAGYHRHLPWDDFPDACFLKNNLLALPVHHQLNHKHIKFIAEKVIDFVEKA